jgi:dolichol-phosphate mannosyltransferase
MIFGGLQMLSVAVLGAYVSRIYREVKARPLFIVDRIDDAGSVHAHAPMGLGTAVARERQP